ncbi:MAG TPA: ATP-binding protein [Frankiaceae bacterium]|nr:ATP-binding protein [Frankiaceae bacterium]
MDVRVRTTLPASVSTPAAARAVVREAVTRGRVAVRMEDVALVVSELVTNAILHGEGEVTLDVVVEPHAVRIAVEDLDPGTPEAREAGLDADSGRGLALVSKIAARWGVRPGDRGKVVWAEVLAS